MNKPKNQKKTVSAKVLLEEMNKLEALAREDYFKAIKASEAVVAEGKSLQGATRAAFVHKSVQPQYEELAAFISIYGDQVVPAHAAIKAAAAKGDVVEAKVQTDKMVQSLEALAAISPELAAKFEAYESRFTVIETKNEEQDNEIKKLWAEICKIHARGDYIEGYLGQATSGKGFGPYVLFGSPVTPPAPVVPPQVPQDPDPTTDPDSLAAAPAAAQTDDEPEPPKFPKKGIFQTLRERIGLGRSNEDGDSVPFRPSQFAGPIKSNNPATAGGAH